MKKIKLRWPFSVWASYSTIIILLICVTALSKCQGATSFQKAYNYIQNHEGNYANNPLDKGGETYRGISRKYNKNWYGWRYVDAIKNKKQNQEIELANFWAQDYFLTVWVKENFDQLNNEKVAAYLFDYRINTFYGVRAIEQLLVKRGFVATVDNHLDSNEILCINLMNPDKLLKDLSKTRVNFYIRLANKYPEQKVFLNHWLQRARLNTLNKAYG